MSNQIDQKITELFAIVRKQTAEVEAAEKDSKQSWKTNCSVSIPFARDENPVNLQTANEARLMTIVRGLLMQRDYDQEAGQILGMPANTQYGGYSYEDWFADCKKRVAMINIRTKKENLVKLEKRLNDIVSPEQKRQMELEAITQSLGI